VKTGYKVEVTKRDGVEGKTKLQTIIKPENVH